MPTTYIGVSIKTDHSQRGIYCYYYYWKHILAFNPFKLSGLVYLNSSGGRFLFTIITFIYLMQTVQTLIRHHIVQHLIWVYTVCHCSFYGKLGINGLPEASFEKGFIYQRRHSLLLYWSPFEKVIAKTMLICFSVDFVQHTEYFKMEKHQAIKGA